VGGIQATKKNQVGEGVALTIITAELTSIKGTTNGTGHCTRGGTKRASGKTDKKGKEISLFLKTNEQGRNTKGKGKN